MKLEIATTQCPSSENISIGKRNPESVCFSWFTVVNHYNVKTKPAKKVCDRTTTEITTPGTLSDCCVADDAGAPHVQTVTVVKEVEMAEKCMMLASSDETEVGLLSRVFKDKSAASHKITGSRNDMGICACADH